MKAVCSQPLHISLCEAKSSVFKSHNLENYLYPALSFLFNPIQVINWQKYLLSSASNWIEAYVWKENSCRASKHSIHAIWKVSERQKRTSKLTVMLKSGINQKLGQPYLPTRHRISNPTSLKANISTSYYDKQHDKDIGDCGDGLHKWTLH